MVRAMEDEQERRSLPRPFSRSIRMASDDAPAVSKKPSDIEMMKEKFAKLLLGEDMSGGGKGVSSAAALSNAITNLAASVFGEQRRLEPMSPEQRSRWRKEIDWLLSVTDYIVELVAVKQTINGQVVECMNTRPRADLQLNIPALRKLDGMLIDCLDRFKDQNEFTYVSAGENNGTNDKWWIPTPRVPPNGLCEEKQMWLKSQKESVNQVLKAAMMINSEVLHRMEVPENYVESLPKNGKTSLGDAIYRSLGDENFQVVQFISNMELDSEHKILDLKNRIEASIVIWRRKSKESTSKTSWGTVSTEKRGHFEKNALTVLETLKHNYPGIAQSSLDISKIQYNKDVGHAILESYSRIIESLAHTVMSRIDEVLQADILAKKAYAEKLLNKGSSLKEQAERLSSADGSSMTLMDCLAGWDQSDSPKMEDFTNETDHKHRSQEKPLSYLQRLELGGSRSPTSRH